MDIIVVKRQGLKARSLSVSRKKAFILSSAFMLTLGAAFYGAYRVGQVMAVPAGSGTVPHSVVSVWKSAIEEQKAEISEYKESSLQQIDTLTLRVGQLQARMLRLDAFGQRLTDVAGLDAGEFDFESLPAVGGPESGDVDQSYSVTELTSVLDQLEKQTESRELQLRILDEIFIDQKYQQEQFIAGRPVKKGWLSSSFGYRSDPFTGKRSWHAGVDFAGKVDSEIVAVAGGVVTYAGDRRGYGRLVEVNHGSGLVTRYAHCKSVAVRVGTVVKKGQLLARMGSSGRSTGPHVHFEVLKDGRQTNPAKFIARASR
ncbi:MAG: M23 family metallopeptidase [Hahellaceae bacterium]|nr:M23 family metallopeptidase [Hahellaceae bacterium]